MRRRKGAGKGSERERRGLLCCVRPSGAGLHTAKTNDSPVCVACLLCLPTLPCPALPCPALPCLRRTPSSWGGERPPRCLLRPPIHLLPSSARHRRGRRSCRRSPDWRRTLCGPSLPCWRPPTCCGELRGNPFGRPADHSGREGGRKEGEGGGGSKNRIRSFCPRKTCTFFRRGEESRSSKAEILHKALGTRLRWTNLDWLQPVVYEPGHEDRTRTHTPHARAQIERGRTSETAASRQGFGHPEQRTRAKKETEPRLWFQQWSTNAPSTPDACPPCIVPWRSKPPPGPSRR